MLLIINFVQKILCWTVDYIVAACPLRSFDEISKSTIDMQYQSWVSAPNQTFSPRLVRVTHSLSSTKIGFDAKVCKIRDSWCEASLILQSQLISWAWVSLDYRSVPLRAMCFALTKLDKIYGRIYRVSFSAAVALRKPGHQRLRRL